MSTEPGSFTSNGSMIVVSNRLPFVLKRNEISGQLERKARLVGLASCSRGRRYRLIERVESSGQTPSPSSFVSYLSVFVTSGRVSNVTRAYNVFFFLFHKDYA